MVNYFFSSIIVLIVEVNKYQYKKNSHYDNYWLSCYAKHFMGNMVQ